MINLNKKMGRVRAKKCNNKKIPKFSKTKLNKKKNKRKDVNQNNTILPMVVTI
jgi:hypothetical protein